MTGTKLELQAIVSKSIRKLPSKSSTKVDNTCTNDRIPNQQKQRTREGTADFLFLFNDLGMVYKKLLRFDRHVQYITRIMNFNCPVALITVICYSQLLKRRRTF